MTENENKLISNFLAYYLPEKSFKNVPIISNVLCLILSYINNMLFAQIDFLLFCR